jgi:hypothetical protein
MPVYRVTCRFTRVRKLLVEAPNEEALYKVVENNEFDPDCFVCEEEFDEWDGVDPMDIEDMPPDTKPMLKITEDGTDLELSR